MCFMFACVAVQSENLQTAKFIEFLLLELKRLKAEDGSGKCGIFVETIGLLDYFWMCFRWVTGGVPPCSLASQFADQRGLRRNASQSRSDLPALVVVVIPAGTILTRSIYANRTGM